MRLIRPAVLIGIAGLFASLLVAGCGSGTPGLTAEPAASPRSLESPALTVATATEPPSTTPGATPARTPLATPTRPARVPATTSRPQPFTPDADLHALIEEVLGSERSSYSVYVKRLADGSGASVNQDDAYAAASIFKLYVMWEAVRQEAAGALGFQQTMEVTEYYTAFELGTNRVEAGDRITVRDALEWMMSVSDTPSAVLLQDTVGFQNINASLRDLGIEDSGLFYPDRGSVATARDIGVLLETIQRGRVLSASAHDLMRALLLSEQTDNGLRAGVPGSVEVAHKTGLLEDVRHDAGIVYLDSGPYVIVVLSHRQGTTNLIPAVARAVFEYYSSRPR